MMPGGSVQALDHIMKHYYMELLQNYYKTLSNH